MTNQISEQQQHESGLIQVVYGGKPLAVTPEEIDVGGLTSDEELIEKVETHFDINLTNYMIDPPANQRRTATVLKVQIYPSASYGAQ